MKKRTLLLVMIISLLFPANLKAYDAVFDIANWIEGYLNNMENYVIKLNTKINSVKSIELVRNQIKQIEQAKQRFEKLQRMAENLSGKNNYYARLLKGPSRLLLKDYQPETEEALIQLMSEGKGSDDMRQSQEAYVNLYRPESAYNYANRDKSQEQGYGYKDKGNSEIYTGNYQGNGTGYQSAYGGGTERKPIYLSTTALMKVSKDLFEQGQARRDLIEELMKRADDTETLKESMDLVNVNIAALHATIEKMLQIQIIMARRQGIKDQEIEDWDKKVEGFYQWKKQK